jgi:carboxypeptidase C (cathepsin A)
MKSRPNVLMRTTRCARITAALMLGVVSGTLAGTPTSPEAMITTVGEVAAGGQSLHYTTQAALLPLYDNDTGELMGNIFIVAYTLDRAPGHQPRPLTFIWNGGPGSSSSELHLIGVGPKGFRTPETYPEWPANPPREIVDRPETWLLSSDLVFIDPIGTGYSRATNDAYREMLYSTHGDIEAVAEAIRIYRTRNDAWDAPVFLAGESYGTERAMGVAEALERRRTRVAGVVLMSGGFDVGHPLPQTLAAALEVPRFAVVAQYHQRLGADLQQLPRAELVRRALNWARSEYAPALEHPEKLSAAERERIVQTLHSFTGVDSRDVDSKSLILTTEAFADDLLPGHALGRYDLRMVGPKRGADNPIWVPTTDPSIQPVLDIMQGTSPAVIRYLRDTLQYNSDLLYAGPFGEAFHPLPLLPVAPQIWGPYSDWMTMKWNRAGAGSQKHRESPSAVAAGTSPDSDAHGGPSFNPPPPLLRAMDLDPHLLVMNVAGLYDASSDSCAAKDEAVARADPSVRTRVRNRCYDAGHTVYTDVPVRKALQRDFAEFVRDATSPDAGR